MVINNLNIFIVSENNINNKFKLKGEIYLSDKNNPLNDGVENAKEKQNLDKVLRMPTGIKKPKNTRK